MVWVRVRVLIRILANYFDTFFCPDFLLHLYDIFCTDYLVEVLRGSRPVNAKECRSVAGTLRRHCVHLFEPPGLRDGLATAVHNGYWYRYSLIYKDPGVGKDSCKGRKMKEVYLVNKRKYYSLASEVELMLELDLENVPSGYSQDDMHRILQYKIRYVAFFQCCGAA